MISFISRLLSLLDLRTLLRWLLPPHSPEPVAETTTGSTPQHFATLAPRLNGLLVALAKAADDQALDPRRRQQILRDWEARVRSTGSEELYQAWRRCVSGIDLTDGERRRRAQHWKERLASWGLQQETEDSVIIDDGTYDRYVVLGECAEGSSGRVVHRCWVLDGTVIEKGLVQAECEEPAPSAKPARP